MPFYRRKIVPAVCLAAVPFLVSASLAVTAALLLPTAARAQTKTDDTGTAGKKNPKDGAELIYIPAGPFLMGDADAKDFLASHNKQHTVTLSGYYIYKNVVTVGMYEAFCKATHRKMPRDPAGFNPDWLKKDHPIVNVIWADAKAYCDWAGGTLPSEAQWEKAARGTDGRKFPWGDTFDKSKLWCSDVNYEDADGTTAVGSFPSGASPYGVLDMAGNVWQWCADWYDEGFPSSRLGSVSDPVNESVGEKKERLIRGTSWKFDALEGGNGFRCATREKFASDWSDDDVGFRCVVGGKSGVAVKDATATANGGNASGGLAIPDRLTQADKKESGTVTAPNDEGKPAEVTVLHGKTGAQTIAPTLAAPIPPPSGDGGGVRGKVNSKDGAELVTIPAGPFLMGQDKHRVTLPAYSIYKNLVTVRMYAKFCQQTHRQMPHPPEFDLNWSGQDNPVVNVSWADAKAYCDWAGAVLPSEAQWEKAARGTDGRLFPWGSTFDASRLQCGVGKHTVSTERVGSFPSGASPYGVLDMAGNVWQWCDDWFDSSKDTKAMHGGSFGLESVDSFCSDYCYGVSA